MVDKQINCYYSRRWLPSASKDLIAFVRKASMTSSESATATITCGSALSSELMR